MKLCSQLQVANRISSYDLAFRFHLDVPLDEMLKKIGIIGGPAVVIIVGLVLVYLKKKETTFGE